jgi:hypothetical protein
MRSESGVCSARPVTGKTTTARVNAASVTVRAGTVQPGPAPGSAVVKDQPVPETLLGLWNALIRTCPTLVCCTDAPVAACLIGCMHSGAAG